MIEQAALVDFNDASRLDDRRFLLAKSKTLGPGAVGVHPRKLFAVVIKDGDLPMAMLSAPVRA